MTTITYKVIDATGKEIANQPSRAGAMQEAADDVKAWEKLDIMEGFIKFPLQVIRVEHTESRIQQFERNQIS